jgi:hypothetical protein
VIARDALQCLTRRPDLRGGNVHRHGVIVVQLDVRKAKFLENAAYLREVAIRAHGRAEGVGSGVQVPDSGRVLKLSVHGRRCFPFRGEEISQELQAVAAN